MAQDPLLQVQAQIDKTTLTTGDFLQYQIEVIAPADVSIEPPRLPEPLSEQFDIDPQESSSLEGSEDSDTAQNHRRYLWQWNLWPHQPGFQAIPPVTILGVRSNGTTEEAQTQALQIEVTSLILPEQPPVLRDIKPQVDVPFSFPWWGGWVIAGLILLIAALGYVWYRRSQRPLPPEPEETPHERAFRRLKELSHFISTHPQEVQQYYYDLSEIFREFLERRFRFAAVSMTTEEFLPSLQQNTPYTLEESQQIAELCQKSDLIKYAEVLPSKQEMDDAYNRVHQFIESIVYASETPTEVS